MTGSNELLFEEREQYEHFCYVIISEKRAIKFHSVRKVTSYSSFSFFYHRAQEILWNTICIKTASVML